jgi:hypothetical protein
MAEAEQLFSPHQGILQPQLVVVLIVKIVNLDTRFLWGKILGMLQVIEILANLLGCEQLPDRSDKHRQLGSKLGMLFRCLDEVEKFVTNQIVQGALQPKVPTNTFGCLALVDPDFVELNG